MKIFDLPLVLLSLLFLAGCMGNPNGPPPKNYPYFEVTEPIIVRNILVPAGTKLTYEAHFFRKGRQNKVLQEERLDRIEFPANTRISWGGVPVTSITKYFNTNMHGFSVSADFSQLSENKKTKFSELWQSCGSTLGIDVKNTTDWSFNTENISDIQSCSVNYQRYFKDDVVQQTFLDNLYTELMKIDPI